MSVTEEDFFIFLKTCDDEEVSSTARPWGSRASLWVCIPLPEGWAGGGREEEAGGQEEIT